MPGEAAVVAKLAIEPRRKSKRVMPSFMDALVLALNGVS
jgi:hypothetical protein